MNHYVVVCDCAGKTGDRHEICRIDDDRARSGRFEVEPTHVGSGGLVTVRRDVSNRRGDRSSPVRLGCPGCGRGPMAMQFSTIAAVIDRIGNTSVELEAVSAHETDVPASRNDLLLIHAEISAMLRGEQYAGERPTTVPQFRRRLVIPWAVFLAVASNLQKDR